MHSHVSEEYIEPLPCRQQTLSDKIAPKYNHGNHKRFNIFVKDRSNMDDRSVTLWMKQKRFKPGCSMSTEYVRLQIGRFRSLSIYLTALLLPYMLQRASEVTAQLPILRQLGSNVRPGKTGSVWWCSTSTCIVWVTVISCGWSAFMLTANFRTPCIKWSVVRCTGHRE
jgi:hypothetical protein